MRVLSWQEMIEAASTDAEVVDVVRDYLSSHHYEIARLPAECKPSRMVNPADVAAYTVALVRHHVGLDSGEGFLHRLTAFMVLANTKITHLLAVSNDAAGPMKDTMNGG